MFGLTLGLPVNTPCKPFPLGSSTACFNTCAMRCPWLAPSAAYLNPSADSKTPLPVFVVRRPLVPNQSTTSFRSTLSTFALAASAKSKKSDEVTFLKSA